MFLFIYYCRIIYKKYIEHLYKYYYYYYYTNQNIYNNIYSIKIKRAISSIYINVIYILRNLFYTLSLAFLVELEQELFSLIFSLLSFQLLIFSLPFLLCLYIGLYLIFFLAIKINKKIKIKNLPSIFFCPSKLL